MKKLYLFLTLVLWGFAQVAEAQNIIGLPMLRW